MFEFDFMKYLPGPRLNLAEAISLLHGLGAVTPADPPEGVLRCAMQLKSKATLLGAEWATREKNEAARTASETRSADQQLDGAVRAVHDRLAAAAELSPERHPEAAQAQAVVSSLFPEGLAWLKLRFDEEWAHATKLLERIDGEGHAQTIDALAGAPYLAELRVAHAQYGKVLGKTQAKPGVAAIASINLLDELKEVSRLVGSYSLQILAMVDESRPETVEAARAALRPLEEFKAGTRSRSATDGKPVEPAPTTP